MTNRIYYTDPGCLEFEAAVTRALEHDGKPAVILDRSAFYPSSGGQPFDTGRLSTATVIDVVDTDDDIVHVLDVPLAEGARVSGAVDRARRLDHMQQHTGQHVLSAAFERLSGNRTVSFHMGIEGSTIDLQRDASPGDVDAAVAEANRIVFEDRPVSIRFVTAEEASRLPLRKEPARAGALRLIEVHDFDLSACGGTHVARTGAIGLIAVTAQERMKGGSRVTFVCGGRALRMFNRYRAAVAGVVQQLSVLPEDLPSGVDRLQQELKALRKTVARMQEELARHAAVELRATAVPMGGVRVVLSAVEGWDAGGLKSLATSVAAEPGVLAVLMTAASPVTVVVARGPGVAVDAGALLRELTARFQGRGGGKPDLAQGGSMNGTVEEVTAHARAFIERVAAGT